VSSRGLDVPIFIRRDSSMQTLNSVRLGVAALMAAVVMPAHADPLTDWNEAAAGVIAEARIGTPPAVRVMAIVQTSVLEALEALPTEIRGNDVSQAAAVAAAHRFALETLLPAQKPRVDEVFRAAVARLPEGRAKEAGLSAGEHAALAVLASRGDDGASRPEDYRPHAAAGAYVPTAAPAVPQWSTRKPWLLEHAAQLRPGPPPALTSKRWAGDFNEIKANGGRNSSSRSPAQTDVARFWEYSLPEIYNGALRSATQRPGRDLLRNARLLAAAAQAMDDALIAVFDAKYHYGFWRPVTAIRNADLDDNPATERDPSWLPLIDTPMHPEYPCAHCILAATVGTVIAADAGTSTVPIETRSPTAHGKVRRWDSTDEFIREVLEARVLDGVHYRFSTLAGEAMGRQIGALAAKRLLRPLF
jgi:hypothetical protein